MCVCCGQLIGEKVAHALAAGLHLIPCIGEKLKTKQVGPQRRLLGGESAVEGDRITALESH